MDEIARLQEEFKKVQQQSSVQRLSDRNCVEIILRLIEKGKLDVIFTEDGKEYITPERLESDIRDEIMGHQGRINILEIPPLLNVSLNNIEGKVAQIIEASPELRLLRGEIIAEYYLDSVAEEINETLQTQGRIKLSELTQRFALTTDILTELIQSRLDSKIHGTMDNNELYTTIFVDRNRAQIRGLLAGITKPTPIDQIISFHSLHQNIFHAIISELKKSGELPGRVERGLYVPKIFSHSRQKWIESAFLRNGFIEYETVRKSQISDAEGFLKENFNGLALARVYVSDNIFRMVDSAVEVMCIDKTWLDITTLLEFPLGTQDSFTILKQCPTLQKRKESLVILKEIYIISEGFIAKCWEEDRLPALISNAVMTQPKPLALSGNKKKIQEETEEEEEESDEEDYSKRGKRGKRNMRKSGKSNRNSGKKKISRSGKRKLKGSNKSNNSASAIPLQQQKITVPVEIVTKNLAKWFPDVPEELIAELANHFMPRITEKCEEISKTISASSQSVGKSLHKKLMRNIYALHETVQVFGKSIDGFSDNYVKDVLHKHLLRTFGTELVNGLVHLQALDVGLDVLTVSTDEERAAVLNSLPSSMTDRLQALLKCTNGKSTESFLEELTSFGEEYQLVFKSLSKKAFQNVLHKRKMGMIRQLKGTTDPAAVYHLSCVLIYAKVKHALLHVPGSAMSDVIAAVKGFVPDDISEKLSTYPESNSAEDLEALKQYAVAKK
eukprot:TRINITY_DN1242_c0_g1_i1.p1 TRINITY_DN1242_c0_g1~~TRINITY_DN1242_c0_g1_i1.p1  ORF type:complete len:728 (+),score=175.51 TRINITY_DN1242_c0_g1_i1:68-2251(+)